MKKALIDVDGKRVAQIEPVNAAPESDGIPFPVAPPLVWVDCGDDVTTQHVFNGTSFTLP